MRTLAIDDRGYPVPWFVPWIDGKPEFRAADSAKWRKAIQNKMCWICGQPLGKAFTFIIGPMCGVTRTQSEPPSHDECAVWSARNCPFLSNKNRKRREDEKINKENCIATAPGIAIVRNAGAWCLWTTRSYELLDDGKGQTLLRMGQPERTAWYANGRIANRAEIMESVKTGLPNLTALAEQEGPEAVAHLKALVDKFMHLVAFPPMRVVGSRGLTLHLSAGKAGGT
jgi:hypothetical protein